MSATAKLLAALSLSLVLAAAADAQSLEGKIERNPDDTVTYTIDLDGPPRGQAVLFMSLWVLPNPYHSPSLGTLYLDPHFWMPITPLLTVPPTGHLPIQFTIAERLTLGLPIVFQSFNLDTQGTLRLSQNAMALAQNEQQQPCDIDYAFAYDTQNGQLKLAGAGPVGATITVQVVDGGNVRHQADAIVGGDGKYQLTTGVPNGVTANDVVQILCNGQPVDTLGLHR